MQLKKNSTAIAEVKVGFCLGDSSMGGRIAFLLKMEPYNFSLAGHGLQQANFLGALAAGIGSILSGGASAVASIGSSLISGAESLIGGGAEIVGGLGSAAISGAGSIISGTGKVLFGAPQTVGETMAAMEAPAYYETTKAATGIGGLTGGLIDVLRSKELGQAAQAGLGLYQLFHPPETKIMNGGWEQKPLPSDWGQKISNIPLPTLPYYLPAEGQTKTGTDVFTLPPASALEKTTDYSVLLIAGVILLLIFMRKK